MFNSKADVSERCKRSEQSRKLSVAAKYDCLRGPKKTLLPLESSGLNIMLFSVESNARGEGSRVFHIYHICSSRDKEDALGYARHAVS